ncbi:LysR family transcriptional regulator [Lonsdalea quercina]|uniref:LysR family transcriptional regulator n=1 Tax=Lonsdalea quercina TaxID=71657 RepID=UPI003975186D
MFLRQLHYLVALAEHRHFAQAAESCWVSQPSLSVALQQMERELGITIIRRERRFQGFTPEGERVLDWARKTLSSLDGLKQEAALAQAVAGGNLVIGAVPSAMRAVSTLIKEYRRVIPRLNLKVFSLSTRDILNRLKNQDLHLGIAYSDASTVEIYESLSLYAERFVLLSNNEVVSPVGDAFSWVDVGELPLCLFNHEMQNRRVIEDAFREAGVTPQVIIETNALSVLHEMVSSGQACSIAPISAIPDHLIANGIVAHPIESPPLPEMSLLRLRKDNQPALLDAVWGVTTQLDLQSKIDQSIYRATQ